MPHAIIKMWTGRTQEQKRAVAKAVAGAIADELNVPPEGISVDIQEYDKEVWDAEVLEKDIAPRSDALIIRHGTKREDW